MAERLGIDSKLAPRSSVRRRVRDDGLDARPPAMMDSADSRQSCPVQTMMASATTRGETPTSRPRHPPTAWTTT